MYSVNLLREIEEKIKHLLPAKEKDINEYLTKIFINNISELTQSSIVNNIKLIALWEKYLYIHLDNGIELKVYDFKDKPYAHFTNYKNDRKFLYNLLSDKIRWSEKHNIDYDFYTKLSNFANTINEYGIEELISYYKSLKEKLVKYPILETRKTCLYFLMCCKFGHIPICKDISIVIAKMVWNNRFNCSDYPHCYN